MLKKTAICIALSALFTGVNAQAATIYEKENGDTLKVYGEVGVGGHVGADYDSGQFFEDESYIDDSFATIGAKGTNDDFYYRVEIDFERENYFKGASGDMAVVIDKVFMGYMLSDNHAIEYGLTDTALDDYDKFGDFTFDTTVETGEAGDQENTIKYEGSASDFKMGVSYSYNGQSSSGSELGDIINGYIGYFSKYADIVVGAETRLGSDGETKYGEQTLYTLGLRAYITDSFTIGLNGFIENEDIGNDDVTSGTFADYETTENKGALISARYKVTSKVELTASANYEEYEGSEEDKWGTFGISYKPSRSVVVAFEGNVGDAAQDAYLYSRVYF